MFDLSGSTCIRHHLAGLVAAVCLPLWFGACSQKNPAELLASAKTYLAKNDRKAAVIQIKNAIRVDPEFGEARFLLGAALLEDGDPAQAEVELRKAQRLGYSQDLVVPKLAMDLLARGQPKKVVDEFGPSTLSSAVARADLATSLAMAYAALGDAPRAASSLGNALSAEPAYRPALLLRARFQMGQKNFSGALEIADQILRSSPDSAEGWKLKGDIQNVGSHDLPAALQSYRKAVAVKPDLFQGYLSIVKLLIQDGKVEDAQVEVETLKKIAPNDPQVRYVQALLAYMKKDMKSAQEQAAQLLKVAPDNVQVLMLAASVELDNNAVGQAQTHLTRALELGADNVAVRRLLVIACLRAGQPEQAIAALYRGRTDKQVDPSLYTVAGDAYFHSGDSKAAKAFFAKAAQLDPKDARKRTSVAVARLNSGETASGLLELQQVAASDDGTSADIALISAYMAQLQLDKAMKAIDALERKQPDQPLAAYLRGRVQLSQHDGVTARKSFARALSLAPTYFPAAASLTALDVAENRLPDAKVRLAQFLTKDPANSKALLALAEVNLKGGASKEETAATIGKAISANPSDPAPRLMLTEFYFRSADLKRAIASAQDAASALPGNVDILEALGQAQQGAGELNQAIASFSKAAEMQPTSGRGYFRVALAQLANKSPAEAEKSLQRALSVQPDFAEAQQALASLYVDTGRTPEALKIARGLQEKRPREGIGYVLEGDIQAYAKDAGAATAAYRSGLKQAASTELAIKLHRSLAISNTAEADRFAAEWQKLHAQDPVFIFHLGDAAMSRKEYVKAQANYQSVLKIQPDNAPALNNLAWLSNELHQRDAIALAEKANELAPSQPAFMDTLATVLANAKRFDEAIALESKALDLQPRNPGLRLGLAKLYIKSGAKEKARPHLEQLAALGRNYSSQPEVSELLKGL